MCSLGEQVDGATLAAVCGVALKDRVGDRHFCHIESINGTAVAGIVVDEGAILDGHRSHGIFCPAAEIAADIQCAAIGRSVVMNKVAFREARTTGQDLHGTAHRRGIAV